MYYEFKSDDAYGFANFLHIEVKTRGEELHFKHCPYCKGGATQKDNGTFSINLKTGQFKCLRSSCGIAGNMITLSQDFDFSLGQNVDEYYKRRKTYRILPMRKEPIVPKLEALKYLEGRCIGKETAEKYEITVQTDKPNILVFPFYDEKGKMQFIKYRKTDFNKEKDKNKEWCEPNCRPILFGMKQCEDFTRLVITEGQLDSLAVAACGIKNATSVPTGAFGFTWIPYCWDWINKFDEVVVFGDYENGKITLLDELKKRLKTRVKHVREECYKDCKDANEILLKYGKEQVIKCVENSISCPVKSVINLSKVEDVDIFKIPKVKTGIKQIDRLLYGGLPMGGVVILSGKSGNGKSTFGSQILVSALAQGHKCFAYSGELPNYLFKAWIDFQIAGKNHVFEYQNEWGDRNYGISKNNKRLISNWYDERCYLYDANCIDGEEQDSIIEVTENVIMQYGVNVILLDNLMTAIELETIMGKDKYDRQSAFAHKLAAIALRHDVLIILVAHKRKNNFSTNENDEIAGSSDIANLGTVTISYDKDDKLEPSQRRCKISKNRLFGKVETTGYILEYDEKSKRIYGKGDDVNIEYDWNIVTNGFEPMDVNEENPFI